MRLHCFSFSESVKERKNEWYLFGLYRRSPKRDLDGDIMAKIIKMTSVITVLAAICFFLLYYFINIGLFLTAAITFGTAAYHFCIRLVIGMLFNIKMQNKADYTKKWYRGSSLEQKLYQKMNIKKWKNKMPTLCIGNLMHLH